MVIPRKPRPTVPAARVGCGTVLTYDTFALVPAVGEDVPCSRHGYCLVAARERYDRRRPGVSHIPPRRSTSELADSLAPRAVTTVGVLRRNRFTLRVVAAAEQEGLVDVDLVSGRVALRSGPSTTIPRRGSAASAQR